MGDRRTQSAASAIPWFIKTERTEAAGCKGSSSLDHSLSFSIQALDVSVQVTRNVNLGSSRLLGLNFGGSPWIGHLGHLSPSPPPSMFLAKQGQSEVRGAKGSQSSLRSLLCSWAFTVPECLPIVDLHLCLEISRVETPVPRNTRSLAGRSPCSPTQELHYFLLGGKLKIIWEDRLRFAIPPRYVRIIYLSRSEIVERIHL